ncbi:MAG TPA: DUF2461 domain-containing protein [Candidatus Dormibacteraeota bacterium]|nr:DUF2461 domain-containing protein [Candidatus Dormibacteraeota bacterium]
MTARFTGWKGDFQGFFLGLQVNNTKAYFEAHRRQYEDEVKQPMVALLAELEAEFGPAHLSRPNRDIRFAADKSPYKPNIYASTRDGGYVSLDAKSLVAAGGRYMLDTAQMARYRKAVASDRSGAELARIVEALRKKKYEIGGEDLKRVPSPHPQDHPRAALLRHKRLIYWRTWEIGPWVATPKARDRVVEAWRDGAELNAWMSRHMDRS